MQTHDERRRPAPPSALVFTCSGGADLGILAADRVAHRLAVEDNIAIECAMAVARPFHLRLKSCREQSLSSSTMVAGQRVCNLSAPMRAFTTMCISPWRNWAM